jgi:dipeptidyl aminopeptidase/acylaminoacyl peptidase
VGVEQVPVERYLNIRSAYQPSFFFDGQRIAFLTNITGIPQVWTVDVAGGWPDQLTFGEDRVAKVACSPADDRLIFARDVGGNERTQLFLLEGDGSGERRLTFDDGAMHVFGAWSADGRQIAFSANRRDRGRYDVYVQGLEANEAEMVWQNDEPGILAPVGFSPDGSHLLVFFLHSNMNHDLYQVALGDGSIRHLTPHEGNVRYDRPAYGADGEAVYCLCDLDREYMGVVKIDLVDLKTTPAAQPDAELEHLALSGDGRHLVWGRNVDGGHVLACQDLDSGETRQPRGLPSGVTSPISGDYTSPVFSPDNGLLAFSLSTPGRTSDVWVWNMETGDVWVVTRSSHAGIPVTDFVEPELIRYPTFDGRQIPAWFYQPRDGGGPRPVVVYVHGGPESQTRPLLYPVFQYLVSRGYAVLAPNVRGSIGYGKTYAHLDDVEKRMDSVADLAHAAYWLHQQLDVDSRRIAIYGGSYGGFMVLAALTTYPDLWSAGVDLVGISNFVTFLENTGPYRRSAREAEYGSLERDREFLERISPIHHVDQIKAPLMVIHGANDPRVPVGEAEQIVDALRARGVPVEFLVYADEGHGLVKLENKLDAYPKVVAFLDRHTSHLS